jgi:hypothetical protein
MSGNYCFAGRQGYSHREHTHDPQPPCDCRSCGRKDHIRVFFLFDLRPFPVAFVTHLSPLVKISPPSSSSQPQSIRIKMEISATTPHWCLECFQKALDQYESDGHSPFHVYCTRNADPARRECDQCWVKQDGSSGPCNRVSGLITTMRDSCSC